MQHYRLYKLDEGNDRIVKGKDLLADSDTEAMRTAEADPDCPKCEIWRSTKVVGKIA